MTYSTNTFTASLASDSNTVNSGAVQSNQYASSGTTPGSGSAILRDGSSYYTTQSSRVEQLQRVDVNGTDYGIQVKNAAQQVIYDSRQSVSGMDIQKIFKG